MHVRIVFPLPNAQVILGRFIFCVLANQLGRFIFYVLTQRQSGVSHQNHRPHVRASFPCQALKLQVWAFYFLCFSSTAEWRFPPKPPPACPSMFPLPNAQVILGRFIFYVLTQRQSSVSHQNHRRTRTYSTLYSIYFLPSKKASTASLLSGKRSEGSLSRANHLSSEHLSLSDIFGSPSKSAK